ncbi:hypothetical protein GO491_10335 [Flavobacteriaceae bacterium Ap0902]|nr:hypothetical protein [Flavobacteriaceae bacterium Ap0902]
MKKYSIFILLPFLLVTMNAQVGIEADTPKGGELLFFPDNADGGIILPRVDKSNAYAGSTLGGELIYDTETNTVAFYDAKTGQWESLTNEYTRGVPAYTFTEGNGEGVTIDDNTTTSDTDGVLKLVSKEKALALPRVPDVTKLPSPEPGTICYDMNSDTLAIFNGDEWSFWE